jgi:hypothetical protein
VGGLVRFYKYNHNRKVVEKEPVEGDDADEDEDKDAEAIEEVEGEDGEDAGRMEVDENAFADEEELPDEL